MVIGGFRFSNSFHLLLMFNCSIFAQERLRTECLPFNASTEVTGAQTIEIDCFQTPTIDMTWRATQLTLDCPLRGGAGSIELIRMTADPDGNFANGRVGGDPPINGPGGLAPWSLVNCQVGLTPLLNVPNVPLAAGTRYYAITAIYRVDDCTAGEHVGFIRPETYSDPPISGDATRSRNGANALIPLDVVDTTLSVLTGTCCVQGVCVQDETGEACCALNYPGAEFVTGKTCEDPQPCVTSCCLPNGQCIETNTQTCESQNGVIRRYEPSCLSIERCCLPDGVCLEMEPGCCSRRGGTPGGVGSTCAAAESCCLSGTSCENDVHPACCFVEGGVPLGANTLCSPHVCCCFDTGACLNGYAPDCCVARGGTPRPDALECQSLEACCFAGGGCSMFEPFACTLLGGLAQGSSSRCDDPGACCTLFAREALSSRGFSLEPSVYWIDVNPRIGRVNPDGSMQETLLTLTQFGYGIAFDRNSNVLYWSDNLGRINRFDGSVTQTVLSGLNGPRHIALNESAGQIYWTTLSTIERANLDGTDRVTIVSGSNNEVGGSDIALDPIGAKIYWAAKNVNKIRRADLDGGNIEDVVGGDVQNPVGIALHGGRVYWSERDLIRRANLNGSDVQTVYEFASGAVAGMTAAGDDLYVTATGIFRIDLTSFTTSFVTFGFTFPLDVTVGGAPTADCQENGVPDRCDVFLGNSPDCNRNDYPDECESFTDADCDGVQDDGDVCPGQDDTIDLNSDQIPDCFQTIPTVSAWGLVVLGLILASAGKIATRRWETLYSDPANADGTAGLNR